MGKRRIAQLLEQLKDNQQHDLHNTAAIFTVAQVAVNQLDQLESAPQPVTALPAAEGNRSPDLPAAPATLDIAELKRRYGSHKECRRAAKQRGITFRKTPSWQQLSVAFAYLDAVEQMVQGYLSTYPSSDLQGVTLQLRLG
ncbi:MAG: hypothetical protein IGS50_12940 [Synechococcales cyanobacterium C42_A2020_086]|jgi:hypothetical protein|nr:hypothetical protein [Synechococcales cyanobacterium C42_A2020_086]